MTGYGIFVDNEGRKVVAYELFFPWIGPESYQTQLENQLIGYEQDIAGEKTMGILPP